MSLTISDKVKAAQEALALLRQETPLTTGCLETNFTGRTKLEEACYNAFGYALAAFNDLHDWPANDPLAYAAFVVFLARELCIPVSGRDDDLKSLDALFNQRLQRARLHALRTATVNDPLQKEVLARILAEFTDDQKMLAFNVTAYTARIEYVKETVLAAINDAHTWGSTYTEDSLPGTLKAAYVAGICAEIATSVGVSDARAKSWADEYTALLNTARTNALNDALAGNTDPVLAELLANFAENDPAKPKAFSVYTARGTAVKAKAVAEVKKVLGIDDASLDDLAQAAADCLAVSHLATACGLDANVKKLKLDEYAAKIAEWRKVTLNAALAANDDPVLAELVANFRSDDPGLANAFGVYDRRVSAVKAEVLAAINAAHDWGAEYKEETLPGNLRECFSNGICARLATACGLPAEAAGRYAQTYELKLARARVAQLQRMMAACPDPVLSELVANFKADDAGLAWMFDVYTSRAESVREMSRRAVLASHHWNFARKAAAFDGTRPADCIRVLKVTDAEGRPVEWSLAGGRIEAGDGASEVTYTADVGLEAWPPLPYAAWVASSAAEIAAAVANAETRAMFEKIASERLVRARVADLNENGSGSALVREVKAVLKAEFRATDADLDESSDALTLRIAEMLPGARKEIMTAHRWNFARVSLPVRVAPGPDGMALLPRPADCVRVEAVRAPDGNLASWSMRGGLIAARGGISEVTYIRDEEDVDQWPPDVRRCLVYRLAADAALAVPSRGKDPAALMQLAAAKLSEAAVQNAREGNPGRAAWGRGRFREAFNGGFGGFGGVTYFGTASRRDRPW